MLCRDEVIKFSHTLRQYPDSRFHRARTADAEAKAVSVASTGSLTHLWLDQNQVSPFLAERAYVLSLLRGGKGTAARQLPKSWTIGCDRCCTYRMLCCTSGPVRCHKPYYNRALEHAVAPSSIIYIAAMLQPPQAHSKGVTLLLWFAVD